MTKNPASLDDKDQRILARLRDNARTPVSALAREVNLSRSATVARVSRLARDGVLAGYTARVRPSADATVTVWFFIKLAPGLTCASVVEALSARPELLQCHAVAGEWDLLVQAAADSPLAVSDLRERLAALPGIDIINTQTVLKTHFDR